MEESPEQVLARLARHRDSLLRSNQLPTASAAVKTRLPPAPVAPAPVARVPAPAAKVVAPAVPVEPPPVAHRTPTEFIPPSPYSSSIGWRPGQSAVLVTLLGLLFSVVGCVLAILAFERLDPAVAFGIVGAMVAAGLIAAAHRVPVALWWTIGVVIGGALGRWS